MKNKIIEILCILFAGLFVFHAFSVNKKTEKTTEELKTEICRYIDINGLTERDNIFFRNTFNTDSEGVEGYFYFSSEDVMDVREILLIKFSDLADNRDIVDKIERYYQSRYEIFAGYAPEQGDLLKNRVVRTESGVLFVYVGADTDSAEDAFLKAL